MPKKFLFPGIAILLIAVASVGSAYLSLKINSEKKAAGSSPGIVSSNNQGAGSEIGIVLDVSDVVSKPDDYIGKIIRVRGKINVKTSFENGETSNEPRVSLVSQENPEKILPIYRPVSDGKEGEYEPVYCKITAEKKFDCGKICGQFETNSMINIEGLVAKERDIYYLLIHSSSTSHQ